MCSSRDRLRTSIHFLRPGASGVQKKSTGPHAENTPPLASLEKIYLPTSKIKPVRVNLAIFLATSTEIRPKIDIPKKNPQLNGNFDGFGKKTTLKKGPPSVHRTQIYLPTSGMGSCTFFLHPACSFAALDLRLISGDRVGCQSRSLAPRPD